MAKMQMVSVILLEATLQIMPLGTAVVDTLPRC
jgi:hypothetical protein